MENIIRLITRGFSSAWYRRGISDDENVLGVLGSRFHRGLRR